MYTTLIEPAELARHCADADWVVIDCRFDLTRPQWGDEAFATSHIPRAVRAHLDRDLSGVVTAETGRHPLPASVDFARIAGQWGIGEGTQVVAYDQGNGAYAARLWWLLRWIGHEAVAVLNGGFAAWQQAGLPVSTQSGDRQATPVRPRLQADTVATTAQVESWRSSGRLLRGEPILVDARSADRFAGRNETLDSAAGHVPGARNHPFTCNLDETGRFLPPERLRELWLVTLDNQPQSDVVSMCGSGVTACHNLLALHIAGFTGARLYPGSWSEWIRDRARPIETSVT